MFNRTFFNDTLRKYTALFGTLFNGIYIQKTDGSTVTQNIKVPIAYSPKDKLLERLKVDPDLDNPVKNQLPRIGFEMVSLEYDRDRKLTSTIKLAGNTTSAGKVTSVYMPVPYNVKYRLYVLVKSLTDGTRIVEQILPYFTPDWTPTVELIPEIGLKYDIPIILDDVSLDDSYEGNFDEERLITWTLDFTLKGYLFGPVLSTSNVIKFANVNIYTSSANNPAVDVRITVQPGLTGSGQPTTNAAITIPYSQIEADDNYDYIVQQIFNP